MQLKENPFYILDVCLSSDRKKIAEAADEIGFLVGAEMSGEAQSVLTNPGKRLIAELSWFPEAQDAEIASIRNSISNNQLISPENLIGYSKLNALIYNFGLSSFSSIYELGFDVVYLDELYSGISITQVTKAINLARGKAGIAPVHENDVLDCHRTVIEEFRKLLNEKLKAYDEKTYIEFATIIAEKYIADDRHNAGPLLFDIIDQYEIRMQSEIETRANQIIQYIDLIKAEQSESVIRKSVPKVIVRVVAWGEYAHPLQLRSKATGLPHELSRKLAYAIRGLIIVLNNERNMPSEAKDLASAMKSSFLDLGEFNELFTKDTETLKQIEKKNEKAVRMKAIETLLTAFENDNKNLLISGDAQKIKSYCDQIKLINNAIKDAKLGDQQEYQLRTRLCYSARNVALGKEYKALDSYDAKYVILVLFDLFQDIPDLKNRLMNDLNMINKDPSVERLTKELYESIMFKNDEDKQEKKKEKGPANNQASGNQAKAEPVKNTASSANTGNSPKNDGKVNWTTPDTSKTNRSTSNTQTSPKGTTASSSPAASHTEPPKKNVAGKAIIIIALVILLFAIVKSCDNSASNKNGSSNAVITSKPTARITAEPTEIPEKAFSANSKVNDYVYIDVISIEPKHAIHQPGPLDSIELNKLSISYYICKCKTSNSETVWLRCYSTSYKDQIDESVSTTADKKTKTFSADTIFYTPAARIHGQVVALNTITSNVEDADFSDIDAEYVISFRSIDIPKQVTNLSVQNVHEYFDISFEESDSSSYDEFVVSYSVKPKLTAYAKREASSADIVMKIQIGLYETESDTVPFQTQNYTVILKKSSGYISSGDIKMKIDKTGFYWGKAIVSCDGSIGK